MSYVYLLGWSKEQTFYYGVRYSRYAVPGDLWVTYRSSSKYVKEFTDIHGEPDIILIRRVFNQAKKALEWESKVLRRMRVVERTDFLNRWDNNIVPHNQEGPFPFEDEQIQLKVHRSLVERYGVRGSGSECIKVKVMDTNQKRYGTYHTLHLDHVTKAREQGSLEIYGTRNPFENKIKLKEVMLERHGVTNMMLDPQVKQKHQQAMNRVDWIQRDKKKAITNLEKYGMSNPLNRIEIRIKHSRSCPYGCFDGKLFNAGNFSKHMTHHHGWTKEQIKRFKNENKKD